MIGTHNESTVQCQMNYRAGFANKFNKGHAGRLPAREVTCSDVLIGLIRSLKVSMAQSKGVWKDVELKYVLHIIL